MRRRRSSATWTAAAALAIFAVVLAPPVETDDEGIEVAAEAEGPEEERRPLPRTRVVRTKYGQVQGRVAGLDSAMLKAVGVRLRDVEIYQGIRYATPPVGNHRYDQHYWPSASVPSL